ncbi:MAG: type II secretion system F family protein [Ramlibacter sp.]|nr:type II secretion system F family protein [Ramlibacter sp.]
MSSMEVTSAKSIAADGVRLKVSRGTTDVWHRYPGLSAAQATVVAQRAGWRVLETEAMPEAAARMERGLGLRVRTRRFQLLLFSQELLTLLEAGLNLTEALETLKAKARAGAELGTLSQIVSAVREGRPFSDVLQGMPHSFPEVYVATVRASERTGTLPQALQRFVAYQQQFDALHRKVVSAAIYPAMLLVVGTLVVLFLLGFVVPRFASVYESSGRDIPALSRALLWLGRILHEHAWLAFGCAVVGVAGSVTAWRSDQARHRLVDMLLSLPGLRERVALFRLSRFYRATSLLLASGIALPRALGMVAGLLGGQQRVALALAKTQLEQGLPVSQTLVANGLASPVAESLVRVGERSGQLAQMLERTAGFHDEELARWIDSASRLMEPLLMLLIGLIIGTVVILMYLPIFDLAGTF